MYFSVIVPVYGTEPYLSQCVDSILAQTFTDFEVILVDDGTPDGGGAICDAYAAKDARVAVIHKENGGLVSARQAGIAAAAAEYVVHADSDDWLSPDFLETAHALIEAHHPDVLTFAVNYAHDDRTERDEEPLAVGLYAGEKLKAITDRMLMTPDMHHMHYFVWGKVFRKAVTLPHQMAVPTAVSMGEDVCCLIPTYLDAESVYVSDAAVYFCRCHDDSMSRHFNSAHFAQIAQGVQLLQGAADKAPAGYAAAVERYCAFMGFVLLASAAGHGGRTAPSAAQMLREGTFADAFSRARFDGITAKSRLALFLLRRGRVGLAYHFLRLCARLKR